MKKHITLTLLLVACGDPADLCGIELERSDPSSVTEDGFCRVVEIMNPSGDERLGVGDECPPDGQLCVVTMPGEYFRTWRMFGAGAPEFGEATVGLRDGVCPATCD